MAAAAGAGAGASTRTDAFKLISSNEDVLSEIFSKLDWRDLPAAMRLSTGIRLHVVNATVMEYDSIKAFIEILSDHLKEEKFASQRNSLEAMSKTFVSGNAGNLSALKLTTLSIKNQLIGVIKTLDVETIKRIEVLRAPKFMCAIFIEARFERRIDQANRIDSAIEKAKELNVISEGLAHCGYIDRAVAVAFLIPDRGMQLLAFYTICEVLIILNNRADKAVAIALSIPRQNQKDDLLRHICNELRMKNRIDQAIEVAKLISDRGLKEMDLSAISATLLLRGQTDKALLKIEGINKAIALVYLFSAGKRKSEVLCGICEALIWVGNIDRALVIAKDIPGRGGENFAAVAHALKESKIDIAIAAVGEILGDPSKVVAFQAICETLRKAGNLNKALEIVKLIPEGYVKAEVLCRIAIDLHIVEIDKSIEVAKSIQDNYFKGIALKAIHATLEKKGQAAKAAEVGRLIPESQAGCVIA